MKRLVTILFVLGLLGCKGPSPLGDASHPDEIRSYSNGVLLATIDAPEEIDSIMSNLLRRGKKWERYHVTTPATEIIAEMKRDGKTVGRLLIGRDFVISDTGSALYKTPFSLSEHQTLLNILKIPK